MKTQQATAQPVITPDVFIREKFRLGAKMSHARTDEEREAIRAEYKTLAEGYKVWHMQTYGWAYGSY